MDFEPDDLVDAGEAADADVALEELPPPPMRRARLMAHHRQLAPRPPRATGERPWWATASRDNFTEAGAHHTEASAKSAVARKIQPRTLDDIHH